MDFREKVQVDFRHNVRIFVLWEFCWGLGISFAAFNTMVPAYLTTLGASKALIGFIQSLPFITTPLQILCIYFTAKKNRKGAYFVFLLLAAFSYLIVSSISIFFIHDESKKLLIAAFSLGAILFMGVITFSNPILFSILTDTIPKKKRGSLFGFRTLALGVSTISMGFAVAALLKKLPPPLNYQLCFCIGAFFYITGTFVLLFLRDHIDPSTSGRKKHILIDLRKQLIKAWNNPNYRMFIFFYLLNTSAIVVAAFIIPFGINKIGITAHQVSRLTVIYFSCAGVGGFIIGRIADSLGYKAVAVIQSSCLIIIFFIVLNADSFLMIVLAYGLYSIPAMSNYMILTNFSVEILPAFNAGNITTLGNIIILPVIALLSPLCGALIDMTGLYSSVFLIGMSLSVMALIGISALIREPRKGRVYIVNRVPRR